MNVPGGENLYRLKMILKNGETSYSNIIRLMNERSAVSIFPNPAKASVNILIDGKEPADYEFLLMNTSGNIVYRKTVQQVLHATIPYHRAANVPAGIYILNVLNKSTGKTSFYKILFQ